MLYKGNITWDAVDWTGPNECCRTAYYIATLCFHASTWEGEGRYDMIVFWLAQNFYWRSNVWVWERKEASLYDCLLSFTLLSSLAFLIQSELAFKFIFRRKKKGTFCKSCMSLRSTSNLTAYNTSKWIQSRGILYFNLFWRCICQLVIICVCFLNLNFFSKFVPLY